MFKFAYFFGSALFFLYWFFLFIKLKEIRSRILFFSFLYGLIGVVFAIFFTADWWRPQTITGTKVGIEDFLLGFGNGGFASAILLLFFEEKKEKRAIGPLGFASLITLTGVITVSLIFFTSLNSFEANCIGITLSLLIITLLRRDLALYSLFGGILMVLSSLPAYGAVVLLFPGWVGETWMMENLSGKTFITIPIEDFVWYFLSGAIISVTYQFYSGSYFVMRKNKNM